MSFVGDGQLEEIVKQLVRIADSLEALSKRFQADKHDGINITAVIEECSVIKIRST